MTSILEFDVIDEIERVTREAFERVRQGFIAAAEQEGLPLEVPETAEIEYILIQGEWADGDAEEQVDPLDVVVGVSTDIEQEVGFATQMGTFMSEEVSDMTISIGPELEAILGDPQFNTTFRFDTRSVFGAQGGKRDVINFVLSQAQDRKVVDVIRRDVWLTVSGDRRAITIEEYIQTRLEDDEPDIVPDEMPGEEEPPEPEPEPEPEIDDFEEPQERFEFIFEGTIEERETEKFEAKAGKETKSIEMRKPYPFEIRMQAFQVRFNASNMAEYGPGVPSSVEGSIGEAIDAGEIGNSVPASAFPKTSLYIREHLKNQGPSYALEIYNDLVWYGWFISNLYNGDYSASSYGNIRTTLFRLEKLYETELVDNQMVRAIPFEEAREDDELDPIAKINKGTDQEQDAPWLEPRQYYMLPDGSEELEAWQNPTEVLYPEEEE